LRILLISDCYYPSKKSGAKLVHDLAVEFRRRGHQPVVLTPCEAIAEPLQVLIEDGVIVARVKNARIKGTGKIQRALREARLSSHLWRGAAGFLYAHPCDLILFYSPSIFFGALVGKLKRLWRCPAYLILRDIFPEWTVEAGILRKGVIYRFFEKKAAEQYSIADVIAVQSPANVKFFASIQGKKRSNVEVLMNWTSLNEARLPQTNYRERLGLEGKTVFIYGGNIGIAQDMDNILKLAAGLLPRSDIHILLLGEGTEVPRLRKAIANRGLTNIQIVSGVFQDAYLAAVSEFDFGLISLDARFTSHNIPGKLLSYLYWGMPVLASVNQGNDLFRLLREGRAGFCIPNGEDEQFLRAALQLTDDIHLRPSMRANARRLLEKEFSVSNAADQIFNHLNAAGFGFHEFGTPVAGATGQFYPAEVAGNASRLV